MARRLRRKRAGELLLTDKKHPVRGIVATILSVISLSAFISICYYSGTCRGNAGMVVGVVGILCLVISIVGFIFAWISLHEEEIRPLFPTLGAVLNGCEIILYMILYILGTAL